MMEMTMRMMICGIHLHFKEPSYDTVSMAESGTLRSPERNLSNITVTMKMMI